MRERLRELGLLVGTAWRTDPWRSLGTLLEPLGGLMYPLLGVCLGVLTDGILDRDGTRIVVGCAGLVLAITLRFVAAHVGTGIRVGLAERVGFAFDQEIARLTGGLPGFEHHERADYQDRLELLRQSQGILGQSLNSLITTANALVNAIGTGVVLALLHPFVLLLVLFALPALPIVALQQRWQAMAEAESAPPSRLSRHLRGLTVDRNAGMELRVFGLQDEVLHRMRASWLGARRPVQAAEFKGALAGTLRTFLFALGFALRGGVRALAGEPGRRLGGRGRDGDRRLPAGTAPGGGPGVQRGGPGPRPPGGRPAPVAAGLRGRRRPRRHRRPARTGAPHAGGHVLPRVVPLSRHRPLGPPRRLRPPARGKRRRPRRRERRGQDHAREAALPAVRADRGPDPRRRSRPGRAGHRAVAGQPVGGVPGLRPARTARPAGGGSRRPAVPRRRARGRGRHGARPGARGVPATAARR